MLFFPPSSSGHYQVTFPKLSQPTRMSPLFPKWEQKSWADTISKKSNTKHKHHVCDAGDKLTSSPGEDKASGCCPCFLPSPPLPSTGVPCTDTPLRAPRFVQEPTQPDGETARQPHCLASLAFKLSEGKLFSHLEEVFMKSRGTSHGWCQSKFNLLARHPAAFPCNLVTKSVSVSSCPSSHSCWTPY